MYKQISANKETCYNEITVYEHMSANKGVCYNEIMYEHMSANEGVCYNEIMYEHMSANKGVCYNEIMYEHMSANKGVCYNEVTVYNQIYFKGGSICSLHHGMVRSFVCSVQSGDQSLPQSHFVLLQAFQVLLHFVAFRLVLQEIRLLKGVAMFILPTSSYNPTNTRPRPLTSMIQTSDLML